ncbi:MAG: pentapeptide repeat-containing protein [Renibacterium sp.]|nr:pentapeptide repeat-containing protein [Renibacterium sp.]
MAGQRSTEQKTKAPRIDEVELPELETATELEPQAHGFLEAKLLDRLDLTDRDLTGIQFLESKLDGVTLHEAKLKSATFKESVLSRINAPVFSAPRGRWSNVLLADSRLGSVELYETGFSSVRFANCKLGYINLRGANLLDVVFDNCSIDELDLGNAKATRVAFPDTRIGKLDITHAVFQDFDLRAAEIAELISVEALAGSTLSEQQVLFLATSLARNLGIRVEN